MIQINLLPVREERRKADIRQQLMHLVLIVMLVGAAIGFVHSRLTDQVQMAESRVRQMEKDIEKFKPQLDKVAAFRKKKAALEKKIDIIEGLDRARSGPVRMMDELATHTPERLWLKTVSTADQSIEISGSSLDNELVAVFLGSLGDSPFFDNVDLNSTKLDSTSDGLKVVSFRIQATLKTPKKKKG